MANTKLITPEATLSYPYLYDKDKNGKYTATFIFAEGTDLTALKRAAVAVAVERWGDKAKTMLRDGTLRSPFRTDVAKKGYAEGSTFFAARTERQPGVVSRIPDPETGKPMPITSKEEMYPGVVVIGSVVPFAYDKEGNKGVSFALNNIQKVRDGERIDGREAASEEFDADESAAADLSDLTGEGEAETSGEDNLEDLM